MRHIRHFLLVLMLMCGFTASAENNYGLVDSIQGGVILHCFGWTYDQITENLENIAEAGFTAVQTLPVQVVDPNSCSGEWTDVYNYPIGLSLSYKGTSELNFPNGNYEESDFYPLGEPDDLKTLCDSAHSFGILVIAEINANGLYYLEDYEDGEDFFQASLKGDTCWHDLEDPIKVSDRYSITYSKVDDKLRDLASENEYVQQRVIDFLKELDSIGVDGIRWHQANYISLPSEKFDSINGTSNFWPAVTTNSGLDLYNYGVINGSPSSNPSDDSLMLEYVKYVSITDDEYGINVIQGFASGDVVTDYGNWASSDYEISVSRIVYIPESSDTYYADFEDPDYTGDLSQNIADRAWAVLASRNDATALYFARPLNEEFEFGDDVNDHFTSSEVAQVNIFHNICNGEPDYYSANDSVISVCRKSGAVLVLVKDSNKTVTATNGGGYTTAGTYTDKLSGNTFTVTDYYITGTIGSTGIAVLYSDSALLPRIILDPDGGEFPDELTVTANLNTIATSGTLQVGDGEVQTITDRTTVTIGEDMNLGDSVTIYWTATDGTNTISGSATYIKIFKEIKIYVKTCSGDTVNAPYIYSWIDGTPAIKKSGDWPGESLFGNHYYIGDEHYFWTKFDSVSYINIIINSGENSSKQTTNITGIDEDAFFYYDDVNETDSTTYSSYKILTPPAFIPDPSIENQPLYVYLVNNAYYDSLTVSIWDNDNNSFISENGNELTHLVSTYDDYGIYYDVYKWNYDGPLTSTPTSLTFTGYNGNKSMTTDTLKFYNGGWYSNAETWFGSQGKVFRTLQVIYDEATANGYYTNTDTLTFSRGEMKAMYTTLVREFDQSYWNTICLPFDVSPDTLINTFGEGTDIEELDTVVGTTLYFSKAKGDSIKAGVPYLIKPGNKTVTNPIFYKTAMNSTLATSVEKQNAEGDKYKFTGTYSPYALDTLTDMFLTKDCDLLHPTSTKYIIKGLRAYITLPDSSTTAAAVSFEPLISTGINRVDTDDDNDADADIYNISGQKVNSDISTLPQGIYITRGRKFIIK